MDNRDIAKCRMIEKDIFILNSIDNDVYLLSSYFEGFGQTIRRINYICGSQILAEEKSEEVEREFEGTFIEYCRMQKVVVDELLSGQDTYPDFFSWFQACLKKNIAGHV